MITDKQIVNALLTNYEAYRNGEDDYAIYLHSDTNGRNGNLSKAVTEKYKQIGEALGGDYKIVDQGCFYYVTTRQLAAVGIDEPEALDYIDQRRDIEMEAKVVERVASYMEAQDSRLLGRFEEVLSAHIHDEAKLYQIAKHLVDTARHIYK